MIRQQIFPVDLRNGHFRCIAPPMRSIDRQGALSRGLADIRAQYAVPIDFSADVLAEAEEAAKRPPTDRADWTGRDFVTLDPATSTDLDPAFAIEQSGVDIILRYAIADTVWFVSPDSALDREAWVRGVTIYLPDGKASLYPPSLCEGAASLLPNVDRPAVVFTVQIDPQGKSVLETADRVLIRSRAKLAYETVRATDLPEGFAELSRRITAAEEARGATRIDAPEQAVAIDANGGLTLAFRPRLEIRSAERVDVAGGEPGDRRCASRSPHGAVPGDAPNRMSARSAACAIPPRRWGSIGPRARRSNSSSAGSTRPIRDTRRSGQPSGERGRVRPTRRTSVA